MTADAELIGWSLAGNDDAFVQVVRRHAAAVSAYLVRRAGRAFAEDLLGEVWVAAFGSRSSYDRSFLDARPWLFGIARNALRAHWRHRPDEETEPDPATMAALVDPWIEVDDRIDGAALMRRVLARLPAQEREVLLLVVWEQLSIADAGRSLGMPAGTARYRLHHARMALRNDPRMVAILEEFRKTDVHMTIKEAR
ncbi:MAG: RNA polymerase sigma factor [Acidimicrobiales bacterium]